MTSPALPLRIEANAAAGFEPARAWRRWLGAHCPLRARSAGPTPGAGMQATFTRSTTRVTNSFRSFWNGAFLTLRFFVGEPRALVLCFLPRLTSHRVPKHGQLAPSDSAPAFLLPQKIDEIFLGPPPYRVGVSLRALQRFPLTLRRDWFVKTRVFCSPSSRPLLCGAFGAVRGHPRRRALAFSAAHILFRKSRAHLLIYAK